MPHTSPGMGRMRSTLATQEGIPKLPDPSVDKTNAGWFPPQSGDTCRPEPERMGFRLVLTGIPESAMTCLWAACGEWRPLSVVKRTGAGIVARWQALAGLMPPWHDCCIATPKTLT